MQDEQDDFKAGNGNPSEDGQSDNSDGEDGGDAEETITVNKAEFEQIKSDRDNYRAATLKKKADERELGGKKEERSSGNQGNSGAIDEAKVTEIAKAQASAILSETHIANENRAKRLFLQKHGEYLDDAQWTDLMANFYPRRGKVTIDDVLEDMEDAVLLHKKSTGKLEEHIKSESERARQQGRIEGELGFGRSAGGIGDRNESDRTRGKLSPKGEEIARGMHIDPSKVAKIDPKKDNVIEII